MGQRSLSLSHTHTHTHTHTHHTPSSPRHLLQGSHPLHASAIRQSPLPTGTEASRSQSRSGKYSLGWVGRASSVDIGTRYGLEGPGIESRWKRDLRHLSRPALRPTQCSVQWIPDLFRGGKAAERGGNHPPHLAPRLKKSRPWLLLPLWAFMACPRVNFIPLSESNPFALPVVTLYEKRMTNNSLTLYIKSCKVTADSS